MRSAVLIAFLFWMLPAAARVADLHTEIRVDKSGELTITERTTVLAPECRQHRHTIHRAARRIEFLADHDALHWSLNGAERITAEIILPQAVPARLIKAEASGRDAQIFVRDGRAAFRARDYMSIVVRFPKGVVADPGLGGRVRWFFEDFAGLILICVGLGLTAALLLRLQKLSKAPLIP